MRFVDEPIHAPHTCAFCGGGSEDRRRRPFLQTDWTWMDEHGGTNNRFYICATCVTSIAKMEGSPVLRDIKRGERAFAEDVRPVPPRVAEIVVTADTEANMPVDIDAIAEAVMHKLVAHEKRKDDERMARARAGKARRREPVDA